MCILYLCDDVLGRMPPFKSLYPMRATTNMGPMENTGYGLGHAPCLHTRQKRLENLSILADPLANAVASFGKPRCLFKDVFVRTIEWSTTRRQVAAGHVARIVTCKSYFVNKRSCPLLQADKYATRHEKSS